MNQFTLSDLQELDERCQIEASKLGLSLPEVQFHVVQAEEIYDIAARGLPGRYSHYQFGRSYEQQKGDYDKGRGRIYELVINTRPVHAYLLDGNGLVAQLLVMAHVQGHAAVYEHSRYFKMADKNILSRARANAERIDRYIGDYGRTKVEDFIDACESLEDQRSYAQLAQPRDPQGPQWEAKKFDRLFPGDTALRRALYEVEREEYKHRFPKEPVRDILSFIEKHSRRLDDWQRDIISIIRSEAEYFVPMRSTQVIHEASACFYHNTILQKLMAEDDRFTTDDFMEYQSMNARVLHPKIQQDQEKLIHCTGINPYLTGTAIYNEVKRICEDPTDEDRERWPWAGRIEWQEKRAELVQVYDDAALLAEFLSPKVCEEAKLFMRPRPYEEYQRMVVSEEECEEVRNILVEQKTTLGVPVIEITDADWKNRGELLLEHRDNGTGLDDEYTKGVMMHLVELWGHPVTVKTVRFEDDEIVPAWYRVTPGSPIPTRTTEEPK